MSSTVLLNKSSVLITPSQCRAGRGLLSITQDQLVILSGVSKATIAAFERGERTAQPRTLRDLRAALEGQGVEFLDEGGGRVGVIFRDPTLARDTPDDTAPAPAPAETQPGAT